ncbi:MAG: SpoVA/SpoVAEb family sporulation membrane protein [Clostridiales bacterium]|nr:SpoVA/SpoVAEb family sporulation membrane protein [Clostridiales bacterium]
MTKAEYGRYVESMAEKSALVKNMALSFVMGGLICVVGQIFSNLYMGAGLSKDAASTATSVTMIFWGALLTALNLYDDMAKVGKAGTIIPITGFANSIVSPAMEFKSEGLVLGLAAKMFVVAGPVLVYGVVSSVIYGLIVLLVHHIR